MTKWWMGWAAVLLLGAAHLVRAQNADSAPVGTVSPVGVAHIAIRVSDLDAEVNFFTKLGFQKAFADMSGGKTQQAQIKINDQEFIQLYPAGGANQSLGFMHVAYEAADAKALNAEYAAAGLNPSPVQQDGAGDVWFTVKDPEGRTTEFMQYLPSSRQAADKGQHLSSQRVSDELLGFELPVQDVAAMQKFYSAMEFQVTGGSPLRVGLWLNPDLHIVLHAAHPNDQPEYLFPVDDANKTAVELQGTGLQVTLNNKLLFVHDPDGNAFVLMETGSHSPRHAK